MKHDSKHIHERTVVLLDESLRATGGFTQTPNSVLKHPTLSLASKAVYGILLSYAWQDEFCFPAQESLAKDCAISVRQVQRYLKELKLVGAISWKQIGLNRPNRYFLHPLTDWVKVEPLPKSLIEKDTTDMSRPDTTDMSSQGTTNMSGQETTDVSYYKDSEKKTQIQHTQSRVSSSSLEKEKAIALVLQFHAENGRSNEGRKMNRRELDFAKRLISEHGFEKASHLIIFGVAQAKETNFDAQHFQAYESYIPGALRDFEKQEKIAVARKAVAEREEKERQKEIAQKRAYYSQPVEERVEKSLKAWVKINEKLKHRKLTAEEIDVKREWYHVAELQSEDEFDQEYPPSNQAEAS
jgi:hypothetical protein